MLTSGATELSDGINEALMEVSSPAEAGLGVRCQHQARVSGGALTVAPGGGDLNRLHGVARLNQPREHRGGGRRWKAEGDL